MYASTSRIDVLIEAVGEDKGEETVKKFMRSAIDRDRIEAVVEDPERLGCVRIYVVTGGYFLVKADYNNLVKRIWNETD